MKCINADTDLEKKFLEKFNQLSNQYSLWQIWQDFVDMSACAIANAADLRENVWKLREQSYSTIVKKYPKEDMKLISGLLSATILALNKNPAQDFLGKIYMQLNFGDGRRGQFFTPWNVAEMMAKMMVGDGLKERIERNGYISVNDCCCGAGCMLIAFAKACKNDANINYQQSVLFVAQDIDPVVAKMCYIQLSLLGCPGYVVIGDSISKPVRGSTIEPICEQPEDIWFTPSYFNHIWLSRRMHSDEDSKQTVNRQE